MENFKTFSSLSANDTFGLLKSYSTLPSEIDRVGYGFNEFDGEFSGDKVIQYSGDGDLQEVGAQIENFFLFKVESYEELRKSLELDAHLSIGFASFSSDVTTRLYTNSFVSRYKQYLLIDFNIQNAPQLIQRDKIFTNNALNVIHQGHKSFVENFGTRYVTGKYSGGRLLGIFEIEAYTETDYRSLSVAIDASIGAWGDFDGQFKTTVQSFKQYGTMKIYLFKSGGIAEAVTNLDEFYAIVKNFPEEVRTHGITTRLILSGYNGLSGYRFSDIFYTNRRDKAMEFLVRIATRQQKLRQYEVDLEYVQANMEQFENISVTDIDNLRRHCETDSIILSSLRRKVIELFLGDYILNLQIPDANIQTINRKPGWNRTKVEVKVGAFSKEIVTPNLHNVRCQRDPCNDKWQLAYNYFEFQASKPENILRNVRVSNCDGGGCGWSGDYLQHPTIEYVDNNLNHVRGNFKTGSHSSKVTISCDEFELQPRN